MEKLDEQGKPILNKDGKPLTEEKTVQIPAFKVVSVFDVSQTEGEPLPSIAVNELSGSVQDYQDFFKALEQSSPVPIGFEGIEGGAHGYFHLLDNRIAIQEGMSQLQTIKTAIHEIAHAKLHAIDPNDPEQTSRPDSRTREVQAESVAYAVCQHYGLDTSEYSFGYVAGWSSGRELAELKASLEIIRNAAHELISALDEHLAELRQQREADLSAAQEAAAAGITVEEYAAAGFEAPQQDSFSIYQLRNEDSTRDYRFEPYDRLQAAGRTVDKSNYTEVYTAPLDSKTTLEDIYHTFNIDHPADFKGHSLSVSDVVVLYQGGKDTAHYCDSFGFQQVPEFLRKNPLRTAELSTEQNENMIDGVLNNAPSLGELEAKAKAGEQISLTDLASAVKAEEKAPKAKKSRTAKSKKPSIRAQLDAAKKEQSQQTPPREKTKELEV